MNVAHLSDLHLRHHLPGTAAIEERKSRAVPDLLQAAVDAIADEAPDLLVISGDLLDYPLDALNDQQTLDQGFKDLQLIAEILAPVEAPLAVVHGNHDHPVLVREVFGHIPMEQEIAGHRVICFFDDEDIDHTPRRLGQSRSRFLRTLGKREAAWGEDGPEWEEDPTATNSLPQIHVQHFTIWPSLTDEDYPYNYRQSLWLRNQITQSGLVRLVLSGHYHTGAPLEKVHNTHFATVPAFSDPPHPYWIYQIDGETVSCQEHQVLET